MHEIILGLALIIVGLPVTGAALAFATAVWAGHLTGSNLTDFRAALFIAGLGAFGAALGAFIAI